MPCGWLVDQKTGTLQYIPRNRYTISELLCFVAIKLCMRSKPKHAEYNAKNVENNENNVYVFEYNFKSKHLVHYVYVAQTAFRVGICLGKCPYII